MDQPHGDITLAQLYRVLERASRQPQPLRTYLGLQWILFIPLPLIKIRQFWHDYSLREYLVTFTALVLTALQRAFRVMVFIMGASFYLHRVLERFFMFGNELTFSRNFFKEVITFILRDNRALFERLENVKVKGDVVSTESDSTLTNFVSTILNLLVMNLNYICISVPGKTKCSADDHSLIYKFHEVIGHGDTITITVYLLYALIGNLICLNILYLYSVSMLGSLKKYGQYSKKLLVLVWGSFKQLI
ncbi:hypothetical protein CLIB1444_02S16204 [[Candida] jaroonii]|uniref:Uncharacterized protein n=1 Tax=[Candida] jaroonii TaxID=467808 RepID=A0ACA9Y460_9ASCO|nr:hypothetical protein CLIB1444_02S16204 [[Candida] jaroonii]